MIDYKLVCLIFLAFGFNTVKSQNINYKTLLGIEHSNLVGDSLKLEKNTFIAFEKMKKAALNDGIKIKVVSAHQLIYLLFVELLQYHNFLQIHHNIYYTKHRS